MKIDQAAINAIIAEQVVDAGLHWQLHADTGLLGVGQFGWLDALDKAPPNSTTAWKIARQRGKSYAALLYAWSLCCGKPGTVVRYAALTGKSAREIIEPTMAAIGDMLPKRHRPTAKSDTGKFLHENGSYISWAGTDNEQFDRLRGPFCHLIILDESAFYSSLERVESALLPQLTTTGGKVLLLSSPPLTPAHTFETRYNSARAAGLSQHATIHDNPRLGPAGVLRIAEGEAKRLGLTLEELYASTYWRREYLAETVTETSRAVVPAWTPARAATLVKAIARPKQFDAYTGADWGIRPDPKGTLFCWYTKQHGLHVERELLAHDCELASWVSQAKPIEAELWGVKAWDGTLIGAQAWSKNIDSIPYYLSEVIRKHAPRQPYLRIGDNDSEVLASLVLSHGYAIVPTRTHDKHLRVDKLNELLVSGRITIDPSCRHLISQLYETLWNKGRTDWERVNGHHGDLVSALIMLANGVQWDRDPNPAPVNYETSPHMPHLDESKEKLKAMRKVWG